MDGKIQSDTSSDEADSAGAFGPTMQLVHTSLAVTGMSCVVVFGCLIKDRSDVPHSAIVLHFQLSF
jgi:hypothetical protein